MKTKSKAVDPERHARDCSVCTHRDRDLNRARFCAWKPAETIATERKDQQGGNVSSHSRRGVARHAVTEISKRLWRITSKEGYE